MFDIWAFLLQTLTASGAALVLLVVKRLFRDKLPPKWQFAVWGILALVLLCPSVPGRYILFHWQVPVELLRGWFRDYSYTQVYFPFPVLTRFPGTLAQWLFAAYVLGVIVTAGRYLLSWYRLRRVLRRGTPPDPQAAGRIAQVAQAHGLKACRTVTVEGLPSAFLWGLFRPVLVLPAGVLPDEKIVLHELLHLKKRDTLWSWLVCLFRCLHWCNPFLIFCSGLCLSDLEARCDQMVLERLEGDERRDYGRTLLAMVNDRFPKVPASTCIHNGAGQISRRIEAISRFKKYPAGMGLVSLCVLLILAVSLLAGAKADAVYDSHRSFPLAAASARATPCTGAAAAFDTYAMAVLEQNGLYRILCAPASEQEELNARVAQREEQNRYPNWAWGLASWPDAQSGYVIYNLRQTDDVSYEGLFVCRLRYPTGGLPAEEGMMYLARQRLRVTKEDARWVTIPLEDFSSVSLPEQSLYRDCAGIPAVLYCASEGPLKAEVAVRTLHWVKRISDDGFYDTAPRVDTSFTSNYYSTELRYSHPGTQEQRDSITRLGMAVAPVFSGEEPEVLPAVNGTNFSSSSSNGTTHAGKDLSPGWGPAVTIGGGGDGVSDAYNGIPMELLPESYIAVLYVNREKAGTLSLYPQERASQ